MEHEIEGYLTGLPTCGPDLRHPVPPITSLFHPHQVPNGRTVAQKKPRKCQLRRVQGATGKEGWAGPSRNYFGPDTGDLGEGWCEEV